MWPGNDFIVFRSAIFGYYSGQFEGENRGMSTQIHLIEGAGHGAERLQSGRIGRHQHGVVGKGSDGDHSLSVTPAAIAGVMRKLLWMRTRL